MRYFAAFLLCLLFLQLEAQNFLEKSQVFETEDNGFSPKFLHEDESKLYTANVSHDMLRVIVYNKKELKPEVQFDLDIPVKDEVENRLLHLAWFKGQIVAFIQEDQTSKELFSVFAYPVDLEKRQIGQSVQLFSHHYDSRSERGNIKLEHRNDKLIIQHAAYLSSRDLTEMSFGLYDLDLQEICLYKYTQKLELEEIYSTVAIDNQNNAFLVNDRQLIWLPEAKIEQVQSFDLPLIEEESLIPFHDQIGINPNGKIIITSYYQDADPRDGFYSELPRISEIYDDLQTQGILYYEFDPATSTFTSQSKNDFEQDYVDRFLEENDQGETDLIPQRFTEQRYFFDDNGDCYLIAEKLVRRPFYSTYLTSLGELVGEYFYLEDLMLVKFDQSGKTTWKSYVPKMQAYTWRQSGLMAITATDKELSIQPMGEFDYYSFYARLGDEGLELFYNDSEDNEAGLVSYEEVEVYEDANEIGPVFHRYNLEEGAIVRRELWSELVLEDELYFKTKNIFYSELEGLYYGVLSLDDEFQIIRFRP